MLDFLDFSFLDALDILLVALLIYYIYKLLKGTVAINIFLGIAFIFLIWKITQILKMEMLSNILGYLLSGGVIALIIVFQQEIRKFLLMIGTTNVTSRTQFLKQLKFLKSETPKAALCLNPKRDGILILSDIGKITLVATTKLSLIMVAPSCNGLFL